MSVGAAAQVSGVEPESLQGLHISGPCYGRSAANKATALNSTKTRKATTAFPHMAGSMGGATLQPFQVRTAAHFEIAARADLTRRCVGVGAQW